MTTAMNFVVSVVPLPLPNVHPFLVALNSNA